MWLEKERWDEIEIARERGVREREEERESGEIVRDRDSQREGEK